MAENVYFNGTDKFNQILKPNFSGPCPHCLRENIPTVLLIRKAVNKTAEEFDAILRCSGCERLYMTEFLNVGLKDRPTWRFLGMLPVPTSTTTFEPEVEEVSPTFVKIYNQAELAELHQLDEIAGPGYRKALEFLVKDYANLRHPNQAEEIRKATLNTVIQKYLKEDRIKRNAERAAWLGNDETHYYRHWENQDIADLKRLVKLTAAFIHLDFLSESYEAEMPKTPKA